MSERISEQASQSFDQNTQDTDVACFSIDGSLLFTTVAALDPRRYFSAQHPCSQLDLSAVSKVDSAGIAWLIHWYRLASQDQRRAYCVGLNEQVADLLRVYEIDFLVFSDRLDQA